MSEQEKDGCRSRADLLRISRQIAASHGPGAMPIASTELILMDVDPSRLHAYWHIEHADLFRARVAAGDPCASLVLCIREPEGNPGGTGTPAVYPVSSLTDSLYVNTPSPGAPCCAEIGLQLRDGTVCPIIRSRVIQPPPSAPPTVYEMIPVDTRLCPQAAPEDAGLGDDMPGPLPLPEHDLPGSSWS